MNKNHTGAVLLVPACGKDRGGGHLIRCIYLLQALEDGGLDGRSRESFLWISEHQKAEVFQRFRKFFEASDFNKGFHARLVSEKKVLQNRNWDYIIIDNFQTDIYEFHFWSSLGTVIGIDEGGPCRDQFDFLIDLLPALKGHAPNLSAPWLLPLPKNRRDRGERRGRGGDGLKVLISFGAEDNAGLGVATAKLLSKYSQPITHDPRPTTHNLSPAITLVTPNNLEAAKKLPGVEVLGLQPNLREHLADYDLFITHYGIGAFEAVYARVPVLLLSPTAYHRKLAKNAGLPHTELTKLTEVAGRKGSFLAKALRTPQFWTALRERFGLEGDQKEDIGAFFAGLEPVSPNACPACGGAGGREQGAGNREVNPVLARFPEETYKKCRSCRMIYLSRLNPPPIAYNKEYFSDFYKKQYGKTYLEDFPKLMQMARKRLAHIQSLTPPAIPSTSFAPPRALSNPSELSELCELSGPKQRLLDIGCAYGPFMAAAAEGGFSPFGVEPIEDAVEYVNKELGFPAWQGYFPTGAKAEDGPFDAVTLWYVIEHFPEPGKVLAYIHRILREGGILAFSTPSYSGISGRKNLHKFLKNSPPDHWTVWSPRMCKKLLSQYGFSLCKIVGSGHHPERFPVFGRLIKAGRKGLIFRLLLLISRTFRLGDTFEIYAKKIIS